MVKTRTDDEPAFRDLFEVAEHSTGLVVFYIEAGRPEVASVLQPVAAALWGASRDGAGAKEPVIACRRAYEGLRALCGADPARHFLSDAEAFLAARLDRGAPPRCGSSSVSSDSSQ